MAPRGGTLALVAGFVFLNFLLETLLQVRGLRLRSIGRCQQDSRHGEAR